MKRFIVIIIIVYFCFMPSVYAAEVLSNGWHVIPASDQKASDSWNNQKKVWALYENGIETKRYGAFIGVHRGWGDAPENSLAAFRSSKEHGYYGVETDVRFTKDNVAVLCHDAYINNLAVTKDLKNISGDKIYIKDLTYSQLKNNYIFNIQRLNVDGNKNLSNYNNRITTFEEMLDFVKQNNMMVSIELKDGTREQIASIVKMADQKGMHNYVRWISFYVNLLEYVKDTDGDELIGVLSNSVGQCNNNSNMYCSGDGTSKANNVYNRVKTNNNMVWFDGYTDKYKLPGTNFGNNMPSTKADTDKKLSNYTLKTIPQGKISINESSLNMNGNDKKEINYNYNGDGTVKCISDNTNIVNCSVDGSKKKIIITSKSNSNSTASVNIYATQGIAYSATTDNKINISITSDNKPVVTTGIVKDIKVNGFNLNFKENTYNYKLKINDQTRLDITCDLVSNEYKYVIDGNDYLKDGSIININIYKNNTKVSTYSITIEKSNSNVPYREVSPVESSNNTSETTTSNTSSVSTPSMSSMMNSNNTTSTTTSSREYAAHSEKEVNNTNNNNTTVTVLKADTPTTNSRNVTPTIVSVPNTDQYNNMIYYMIALSLFVLSYYVIKSYRKKIKN